MYDERFWRVVSSRRESDGSWSVGIICSGVYNRIALPWFVAPGTPLIIQRSPVSGDITYVAIPRLSEENKVILDRRQQAPAAHSS